MNDNAKWRVARLEELERRGRFIPVREHLGIHSFGINAVTLGEDGTLINEHDESGSGQEEVYVVLDGTATFHIDGETFDVPAGIFVSVPPESRRKATGDATVLALGGTPGTLYQALPTAGARGRRLRCSSRRPAVRGGSPLSACRAGCSASPLASRRRRRERKQARVPARRPWRSFRNRPGRTLIQSEGREGS